MKITRRHDALYYPTNDYFIIHILEFRAQSDPKTPKTQRVSLVLLLTAGRSSSLPFLTSNSSHQHIEHVTVWILGSTVVKRASLLFPRPAPCLLSQLEKSQFPRTMAFNNLQRAGATLPHSALGWYSTCRWREKDDGDVVQKNAFPVKGETRVVLFSHMTWSCAASWFVQSTSRTSLYLLRWISLCGIVTLVDKVCSKSCSENNSTI